MVSKIIYDMKLKFLFFCYLFVYPFIMVAQPQKQTYMMLEDRFIYDRYISYIYNDYNSNSDELIIKTAKFFLNTPYVANTLELEPEGLVVNLRELDCTTFLETVYSLVMTVKSRELSFESFKFHLQKIRYRNGVINDYSDRLHYTSDWMYENQSKKIVKMMSKRVGKSKLDLNLYIMSTNFDKYRQLKGNEDLTNKIKGIEQTINHRKYYFIPTEKIEKVKNRLKSGDMVGFVTTIPGIDISHVGIIYKEGERLTFYHASSSLKKVVLHQGTLYDYVKSTGKNTGIVVSRPIF